MRQFPWLLFFLLLLLLACSGNRLDVDVSDIKVPEVTVDRLEQDAFNHAQKNPVALKKLLEKKYGDFYLGFQSVINSGGKPDSSDANNLYLFISDSAMKEAYNDCEKTYPDLNQLQITLRGIFRHFHYYFPDRKIPRVVSYMSGFNYSLLPVDSTIGIALEMYLGSGNKFYNMIQFPKYKTMTMSKEYMASDFARGWMTAEFPNPDENKDFLNQIIYRGKLLYLVDALLPKENDTIKMGYTKVQMDWCRNNEYNMWAYLVQKKILYISDPSEIIKYTGEGPFTSAFNKESPSRVGIWIGWQIVRSYMNRYPKVSCKELMDQRDAQTILYKSKYKPSK